MSINYKCRHCGQMLGRLEQKVIEPSALGLDRLTAREMQEMVHYDSAGNMQIDAICEDCEQTLGQHPNYHELDYFIQ